MFLPTMKNELFPEPPPPAPSSPPPMPPSPPLSQSPTNQPILNLVSSPSGMYPYPIPPRQATTNEQLQYPSSPMSQSPVSDSEITSAHLSSSPILQEFTNQQPVTPAKKVTPNLLLDTKESQQIITLVNQQIPSIASPVTVQPATRVYNSVTDETQQIYQNYYGHQIGLTDNSTVQGEHSYLPQMQDFHAVTYADPFQPTKQSEVS